MSVFQIVSLAVLGLLFVGSVAVILRGRVGRRVGLFWSAVWLMTGVAIAWPGSTAWVAHTLGIGRGADLVLYCSVVLMLIGFFMTYTRLRRLDANLTLLTRHLALREPLWPDAARAASRSDEEQAADCSSAP